MEARGIGLLIVVRGMRIGRFAPPNFHMRILASSLFQGIQEPHMTLHIQGRRTTSTLVSYPGSSNDNA